MGTEQIKAKAAGVSRPILDEAHYMKAMARGFEIADMILNRKPEPHDFCVKCDTLVRESNIEWVDDQPYCQKCYGKLPEIDVDAEEEHLEDARENEVLGQ